MTTTVWCRSSVFFWSGYREVVDVTRLAHSPPMVEATPPPNPGPCVACGRPVKSDEPHYVHDGRQLIHARCMDPADVAHREAETERYYAKVHRKKLIRR